MWAKSSCVDLLYFLYVHSIHTYIHTYLQTYIHNYIHVIHTNIHTLHYITFQYSTFSIIHAHIYTHTYMAQTTSCSSLVFPRRYSCKDLNMRVRDIKKEKHFRPLYHLGASIRDIWALFDLKQHLFAIPLSLPNDVDAPQWCARDPNPQTGSGVIRWNQDFDADDVVLHDLPPLEEKTRAPDMHRHLPKNPGHQWPRKCYQTLSSCSS